MYIKRYIEDIILRASKSFKIIYLGGPRQVGKTTVLLHLAQHLKMQYVSLDDLNVRRLAETDPELFLQKFKPPVLIDEIQYAPELFPYIKIYADKSSKNGGFWLTGSQQFSLMKNVKESLAGRVGILKLLGFSMAELEKTKKSKNAFLPKLQAVESGINDPVKIFKFIFRGCFPALYGKNAPDIELFYNSYLQTYIDRDLKDIFHVSKISDFHKFLQLCAARTGQILNYSDLARDAGISVHAAKEWIGILESSMQIYLLRPYYKNISKRLIKAPKLYFLDTGLAAFLTKWKTPATLMNGAMAGAFFETFAITEIIKSYLYRGEEPPIYYFRDKEGHEVDLVIEKNGEIYPVEIKIASRIMQDDIKNINYLRGKIPNIKQGSIVCFSNKHLPIDRKTSIVPVNSIS